MRHQPQLWKVSLDLSIMAQGCGDAGGGYRDIQDQTASLGRASDDRVPGQRRDPWQCSASWLLSCPCIASLQPNQSVHSFQTSLLVLTREVRSPGQKGAYEESLACPLTLGCIHCHDLSMTGFFDLKVPSMQETIHYPGSFPLPSADWHLRLAFLYVQNLRL